MLLFGAVLMRADVRIALSISLSVASQIQMINGYNVPSIFRILKAPVIAGMRILKLRIKIWK
jgi:hypothetical protein